MKIFYTYVHCKPDGTKKISDAKKGKIASQETREKMSASHKKRFIEKKLGIEHMAGMMTTA